MYARGLVDEARPVEFDLTALAAGVVFGCLGTGGGGTAGLGCVRESASVRVIVIVNAVAAVSGGGLSCLESRAPCRVNAQQRSRQSPQVYPQLPNSKPPNTAHGK